MSDTSILRRAVSASRTARPFFKHLTFPWKHQPDPREPCVHMHNCLTGLFLTIITAIHVVPPLSLL
jgi:hypothetical protein